MPLADPRAAWRALLLADAGIAALVAARVYPVVLPQGERQASISYFEVSGQGDHHMQGPSGLMRPRLQVTAWAPTANAAYALGLLVKAALDGFSGPIAYPGGSLDVKGIFFDSARDLYDAESQLFGRAADFIAWYGER